MFLTIVAGKGGGGNHGSTNDGISGDYINFWISQRSDFEKRYNKPIMLGTLAYYTLSIMTNSKL